MAFKTQRAMFPQTRMRRLRAHEFSRRLVRESALDPADLIFPVFVLEGSGQREAIASMPGIERLSVDLVWENLSGADRRTSSSRGPGGRDERPQPCCRRPV